MASVQRASRVRSADREDHLGDLFRNHYSHWLGSPAPPFRIEFYPYAGLNHTIRVREGEILVRISDVLEEAPQTVLSVLLVILLHKLMKKRVCPSYRRAYQEYSSRTAIREAALQARRRRGRKNFSRSEGQVFDLSDRFYKLNRQYFGGQLRVRMLVWSQRRHRTVLGHYDPAHDAIVLNRGLDDHQVPAWVLEYVLFHEMLHAHLGEQTCGGQRFVHHAEFREAEKRFVEFDKAKKFIRTGWPVLAAED